MSLNKTYAVFGLGRYGFSVAKELVNSGVDVIAVDTDEQVVNKLSNELPFCKCADTTDVEVLKRLGIANVDTVIAVSYTHLRAHETVLDLVCRLLLEKKKKKKHYKKKTN